VTTSFQPASQTALKPARTLSKSDFILARSCAAKLFFRENGYPDNRDADPYVRMLATGGFMVEALANARYPNGVRIDNTGALGVDVDATLIALRQSDVTIFGAALADGRKQARVDIMEKKGNVVRLIEVKAKAFDGREHIADLAKGGSGVFRQTKGKRLVRSEWRGKLEDLTYQVLLIQAMLPGMEIRPFLALIDNSKRAGVDNVPQFFELTHRRLRDGSLGVSTARYTGTPEQLVSLDLVTEVDVSDEVDML
jgi:hypothetical protein